ncbi:MAG TPA: efflux RND transporter permease subunit [Phenylobacterium sp.]|uniref:efflux RND transporter permease subunit n=1 Tax=Phenylobacterium sp. TaxID=1871053 RepID=UPI002B485489|nr:efflux RND transporter permease subunit [Phenylobacterium sp.]HKR87156.1 efflux RND transporter permease subunit [Phenylobacterium sp.]
MSGPPNTERGEAEKHGGFRISAWAIQNPVPVAVLFLALVLAGMIAYAGLPVKQFPNITFPLVTVTVTQNGAAPAQMETQVTRVVEDALAGLSNVEDVQSVVTQGSSVTSIQFEMGEDLQKKTDDVRSAIDGIRAQLPRDIDEPIIKRVEIDGAPILTYAVTGHGMSDADLSWFVDDTLSRALQGAKGVAQISRVGGVSREINVLVDPDRLAARGLTASQVNNALRTVQTDSPGGRVDVGGREQTLRVVGTVDTLRQLRELTIPTTGSGFVKLTDVADIGDGASEPRGFARLNDRPVVGFQVTKTREASDVSVDDAVKAKLAEIEKAHPEVKFTRIFSSVDETRSAFRATQHVLLEGMILAALVVLFFLRDWRATVITAFAMPISLIPTFLIMQAVGFSLNVVTLLALTLVIGILVDDAIVEIENIEKRVAAGLRPYDAAMIGADAIGLAVVATTMAIVVVFTPVSFMPGIGGQFFREFGLTVAVAVLFSLIVARLLTPLLAAYFLKPTARPHERKPFEGPYRRALEWALDHRIVASTIGGAIFLGSLALVPMLPQGFQPIGDPDYIYVGIQGPPGATVRDMERTSAAVTAVFKGQPEVKDVFIQVGSTAGFNLGGSDLRSGTATVLLKGDRKASGDQIRTRLHQALLAIPDARLNFLNENGEAGFQQVLTSDDPHALQAAVLELERQMRGVKELRDARPSYPPTAPEVVIRPRPEEAARLGVSTEAIATAARVATVGDIDANVAKFDQGERRIPIRVRIPSADRANLERIRNLRLPTATGGVTTLGAVADVDFRAGAAQINRLDRARQMGVKAELAPGIVVGQAAHAVEKLPIMKQLPKGVRMAATGDAKFQKELFGSFGLAVFAGVAMIYGVLILLFRSFFKPVVILSALPLAVGGAFLGLLIFHLSLSIPSLIGFLMLLGLAAKNSILLVEYAIEREREGMPQRQALLEACRERARPIVMTTFAMAAGMLPTAFAIEKGSEFRQPMAVAVIGGLITSTMLSLVLVPVVYEFVDDFEQWLRPKLGRLVTPRDTGPAPIVEEA